MSPCKLHVIKFTSCIFLFVALPVSLLFTCAYCAHCSCCTAMHVVNSTDSWIISDVCNKIVKLYAKRMFVHAFGVSSSLFLSKRIDTRTYVWVCVCVYKWISAFCLHHIHISYKQAIFCIFISSYLSSGTTC